MRNRRSSATGPTILFCLAVAVASTAAAGEGVPPIHKLAFVTSVTGTGDLGSWPDAGVATGLAAADAICVARATAAGLPSPSDFTAWMSDMNHDAYCRIHGFTGTVAGNCGGLPSLPSSAGPWVRIDGHPFAAVISEMLEPTGRVYTPVLFDEFGSPPAESSYFTATGDDGIYFANASSACINWTAALSSSVGAGSPFRTTSSWSFTGTNSCHQNRPLLCMQVESGPPLPPILNSGGLAFVTSVSGLGRLEDWPDAGVNVGIAAADAICRTRAQAGGLRDPDLFKAWISTSAVNAPDRISFNGPWVRLDGVVVAQSKTDLLDGELFGPINQDEYGAYVGNRFVLTGTDSTGLWGGEDCHGWSSDLSNVFATSGRVNEVQRWTDIGYGNGCAYQAHLFCFSEVENGPVLFFNGFESGGTGEWTTTVP